MPIFLHWALCLFSQYIQHADQYIGAQQLSAAADGEQHPFNKYTRYYAVPPSKWMNLTITSTITQFLSCQFREAQATVGDDTLYEDLLKKVLPDRHDVDEWYYDVYTPLIQAIYSDSKEEASKLLKKYCQRWYPAFEQAPWHDTHLQGEHGIYVGYWAFEAGAIAFLYGIDDNTIDHMVYPKDLVEYARSRANT
ncbi:hypothetical protein J3D54_004813 [Pseudomonas sp. GGS8]|nr:hypothetical protein [Pseudomonas sp. GGS8]